MCNLKKAYLIFWNKLWRCFEGFHSLQNYTKKLCWLESLSGTHALCMCEPFIRNEKCKIAERQLYDLAAHSIITYDDCVQIFCILPNMCL